MIIRITFTLLLAALPVVSWCIRLIDLVEIEGVRRNQLTGYGLVVGLQGTGDQTQQTRFTSQSITNMLRQFGVQVPAGKEPRTKNVAAVGVSASLSTYARSGQALDVQVSSIGDAKSLRGGLLLATPLKGMDGNVYAVAQGSVVVGGISAEGATGTRVNINTTTTGRIPGGATVERTIIPELTDNGMLRLNLHSNSFSQSRAIVQAINQVFGQETAQARDGSQVLVSLPDNADEQVIFVSMLEQLDVKAGIKPARVVINARTGTIVIGTHVQVRPVAVSHGSTTVKVLEQPAVSQPAPFSRRGTTEVVDQSEVTIKEKAGGMFMVPESTSLEDIVNVINSVGASPTELISIIQAIHSAGAMDAELIVL